MSDDFTVSISAVLFLKLIVKMRLYDQNTRHIASKLYMALAQNISQQCVQK